MKKIHFENLSEQKIWIALMILSIITILLGLFQPFNLDDPKIYKYCSAFGFLSQALFYSRLFWYKYNVQWNKKGVVLRIKPFFGKSIRFEEIKSVELIDNSFLLTKKEGKEIRFDLSEVIESDKIKLVDLIRKYSDLH